MGLLRLAVIWLLASTSHASTHLLIVGADRYPALSAVRQLPAVRNDVALVRESLGRYLRPISTIELSERKEALARPDAHQISAAMNRILNTAHSGDWVVAYFAGHGTQVPAARVAGNAEPDGLDETFLPADVQLWDKARGILPGALSDNAIHDWWQALQRRNIAVWLIFDTCHSGDMAKAVKPHLERRVRSIPPSELGVPEVPTQAVSGRAVADRQPKGGYPPVVGFYAAQADETTTEEPVRLANGTVRGHGIFTYALVQALESGQPADLEQLAAAISARYRAENRLFPTPTFEGPLKSIRPWAATYQPVP